VIYAVIIGLWGAYFIPLWLRRQEQLSESRSVERFSQAMGILSRKPATADQRYVVMPKRAEPAPTSRPARPRTAASRHARSLAIRRRRILAGLLLVTVLSAILTPITAVPWFVPMALLLVTAADVVHLRLQARRSGDVSRTRDSVRRRTRSRLRRFDAVERLLEARGERQAAAEAAEAADIAEAARLLAEAAEWQPVPVPLPTYVTKPKAPERPSAPLPSVPVAPTAAPLVSSDQSGELDELDDIIERRRAVND
jgi:hypothetical protein